MNPSASAMSEIYLVNNRVGRFETNVEYVGRSKEVAQKICNENQSDEHPCFIQVWEHGEKQYVTRVVVDE